MLSCILVYSQGGIGVKMFCPAPIRCPILYYSAYTSYDVIYMPTTLPSQILALQSLARSFSFYSQDITTQSHPIGIGNNCGIEHEAACICGRVGV